MTAAKLWILSRFVWILTCIICQRYTLADRFESLFLPFKFSWKKFHCHFVVFSLFPVLSEFSHFLFLLAYTREQCNDGTSAFCKLLHYLVVCFYNSHFTHAPSISGQFFSFQMTKAIKGKFCEHQRLSLQRNAMFTQ